MTNTPSVRHLALSLGALVAIGPFAIDTYLPALPAMAEDLATTTANVERSVSLYLVGAAIGQIFGGPISDKFGRKPIAIAGLALFVAASLMIVWAPSVVWLDVLRVLQALGGGITVITSSATVRDHFQGREAAKMITAIGMVMLIAPLVAPTVGTFLLHLGGWHAIFISLAIYALFLMGVVHFALPAERIDVEKHVDTSTMMQRWGRVLSFSPGLALIFCNGFTFSAIFAFITDSAFLYLEFYDVGKTWFPVLFGANVVAMLVFNRINVLMLRNSESHQIMSGALVMLLIASTVLLGQFLIFGKPTLYTVVPNIMLIGGLVALIMPNGIASLLQLYPRDSGTASGLNGAGQYFVAGLSGVGISMLHNHTPIPMASIMVVSATLALVLRWYAGASHDLNNPAPDEKRIEVK
ncbi:MAG: multidrug effflux MFS transporter [Alcanivoracaceae bacterium]|nr:multidrug effflux MFS transporter [Alcanivoracaceae bacterium]